MLLVEEVGYFNGVRNVTRKLIRSELIPGIYYVYDEYECNSERKNGICNWLTQDPVLSKDGNYSMGLLEASELLEEVRQ